MNAQRIDAAPKSAQRQSAASATNTRDTGATLVPPAYGIGLADQQRTDPQQLTKQFGPFLAAKILTGSMTIPEAARALRLYRATDAGKRDLFFHDNAMAALAAKQKLEASNIAVEGYSALAAAPELLASGTYKFNPNYRKNVIEQLEEQLAEATIKARESGLEVVRRAYREKGPIAALDAAKEIGSFADDPMAAVNLIMQEVKQREEAEKRSDLLRQAKYRCKKEMIATDEMCDDFFDNLGQQATLGPQGEIEFSTAQVSGAAAKGWQLTAAERESRESLVTPDEKHDRQALRDAKAQLFRIDAAQGAGKAISTGFYDLFIGMPGDLITYGSNSLLDTNHAYSSSFGKELSAELAKGDGTNVDRIKAELAKGSAADMGVIQGEIDKGHFNAAQLDILTYELRRGDRDFRKIAGLLDQGKGTDRWKVADMVAKTAVDVGSTILTLVPGAQGAGLLGKTARVANLVGDVLTAYDRFIATKVGLDALASRDGRAFGEAFGGMLQAPLMKHGFALGRSAVAGLGHTFRSSWRGQGGASIDFGDPALHAARSSGSATGPAWSQMSAWQRFTTSLGGQRAIRGAKALDFDVHGATDRAWASTFGDEHIGKISKGEQASIAAGNSVPGPYIHSVRRGNAFEFASTTNIPIFKQVLTHILFENPDALIDVGTGGHGGVRGNSFIDSPALRDPSFAGANERMAVQAGAMANIWDLADPWARKSWFERRKLASSAVAGVGGQYSIADWCWSAFTGADGKGPMRPLADWDAHFDDWNHRQRHPKENLPDPIAASKAEGGGLYMGSDIRAAQIAILDRNAAVIRALENPRQWLRDLHASRSADVVDPVPADSSSPPAGSSIPDNRAIVPRVPMGRDGKPWQAMPGNAPLRVQGGAQVPASSLYEQQVRATTQHSQGSTTLPAPTKFTGESQLQSRVNHDGVAHDRSEYVNAKMRDTTHGRFIANAVGSLEKMWVSSVADTPTFPAAAKARYTLVVSRPIGREAMNRIIRDFALALRTRGASAADIPDIVSRVLFSHEPAEMPPNLAPRRR